MTPKEYRLKMNQLKKDMKGKDHKYVAYLNIRGKYYRGFSVEKKKDIEDRFPDTVVNKVKYKDKVK